MITQYLFTADNLPEYSYKYVYLLPLIPSMFSLISLIVFVIKS